MWMSQFQPVKFQHGSFHKKLFWALLLFTSMQSQKPSYCRNSQNQTLPQSACVCRAAPRETNQARRHHRVHFLHLNCQQAAVCKRKLTSKNKQHVSEATYRVHSWGEDGDGEAQEQQPAVNEHDSVNDADRLNPRWCFKVKWAHNLLTSDSSVLCCVVLAWSHSCGPQTSVPLRCLTCGDAPTAWLPDLRHTKTPNVKNHCLFMSPYIWPAWLVSKEMYSFINFTTSAVKKSFTRCYGTALMEQLQW